MKKLLIIAVILLALGIVAVAQFTVPGHTGAPASAAAPSDSAYYGPQIAMDGLNNQPIGRTSPQYGGSIRFRAGQSASNFAFAVRLYLAIGTSTSQTCGLYSGYYSGGNGGTLLMQLETDDGTSSHRPSGTVLASYTDTDPLLCNDGSSHGPSGCSNSQRLFTFSPNVSVTAGNLYHIVFSDTDPQPNCNWISVDNLYNALNTANVQPTISDTDLRLLRNTGGSWADRYDYTPIFDITYPGGIHQGQTYMYKGSSYTIQGTNKVRETFTVSRAGGVSFNKAFLRVSDTGSPGPGTVTVQTAAGTTVASGTFTASGINAKGWAEVDFGSTHTLSNGGSYNFVVSAGADGSNYYTMNPMQVGTAYGFFRSFPDGHFQYTSDGSTWNNYPSNRTDFDLSFYLEGEE